MGVPDPSEVSWSPVLYWLELVAEVLEPTDCVDIACEPLLALFLA
jgi:hypothetical protein